MTTIYLKNNKKTSIILHFKVLTSENIINIINILHFRAMRVTLKALNTYKIVDEEC